MSLQDWLRQHGRSEMMVKITHGNKRVTEIDKRLAEAEERLRRFEADEARIRQIRRRQNVISRDQQ